MAQIFEDIDTKVAEKAEKEEKSSDTAPLVIEEKTEEELEIDMDDFLKQGGLDIEEMKAPQIEDLNKSSIKMIDRNKN